MCIQWIPGHEQGVTPSTISAVSEGLPRAYDIILKINRSRAISYDVNIIMRARGGGLGHDANIARP